MSEELALSIVKDLYEDSTKLEILKCVFDGNKMYLRVQGGSDEGNWSLYLSILSDLLDDLAEEFGKSWLSELIVEDMKSFTAIVGTGTEYPEEVYDEDSEDYEED
jgi:hypothetical protein